jgi:flagellin-like hook-associated protein FlgL
MSSNIVLSAAVRQNLLSLQSTAQLLATTQNDLATGNKVNSALDDPTSYFTAQALNTRASNISNLLNGISNGVQVLQAANTGITSLQSLVQNAQSIANQALQAPIGYSTKSNYSTTISGATSSNLLGNSATLSGEKLTFSSFDGGTAVTVTFGDGTNGTVKSLSELNAQLQADNLSASIDTTGNLTISTANSYASSTLGGAAGGVIGGTAFADPSLTWTAPTAPIADPSSQTTRANLVVQYNNILDQINKTAQDASYNGINLLNGDNLQLVFDETGKSTLNIAGTTDNANGLGLANLTQGTDFVDNNSTNQVLASLTAASDSLESLASTLGSNLSVVQNRQAFNTSLINVLQTGASNLTIADPNELAAQSQALTTRQSIAVSALALANQNQQSVLQLLR